MSTDLVAFLKDRLAEDEQTAREATTEWAIKNDSRGWASNDYWSDQAAAHGRRWNPDRVLRECAVKRRIIELYESSTRTPNDWHDGLEVALELLATSWRDHPDYREDWWSL